MAVKIMDMTSGEHLSDAERYGEEVLNANWLPQQALELGLQQVAVTSERKSSPLLTDLDAYMSRLYSAQE